MKGAEAAQLLRPPRSELRVPQAGRAAPAPRTLGAGICIARDFFSVRFPLLDHEVGREPPNHGFNLGQFVLRNDSEVGGLGADRLVFDDRHRDRFRAVGTPALAGEVDHLGVRFDLDVVRRHLGHALVDFPEERLIAGESFVSIAHRNILRLRLFSGKGFKASEKGKRGDTTTWRRDGAARGRVSKSE